MLTARGELWYFKSRRSAEPLKAALVVKGGSFGPAPEKKKKFCILIETGRKKSFYFALKNKGSYHKWMQKLFEAGGTAIGRYFENDFKKYPFYAFPYTFIDLFDTIRYHLNSGDSHYIFQKEGSVKKIEMIKESICSGEVSIEFYRNQDIYDLCDVIKHFGRSQPEAIMCTIFEELMDAQRSKRKEKKMCDILNKFKTENILVFGFCREFFALLHEVGVKSLKKTRQTPKKLAPLFTPMFLRNEGDEEVPAHHYDKATQVMIEFIRCYSKYFGEVPYRKSKVSKAEESEESEESSSEEEEEEEESSEDEEEEESSSEEEEEEVKEVKEVKVVERVRKVEKKRGGPRRSMSTVEGDGDLKSQVKKLRTENLDMKRDISQLRKLRTENLDMKRDIRDLKNRVRMLESLFKKKFGD